MQGRIVIRIGNDNESVLNGLIATALDSVDGYRKAADSADNQSYRSLFSEYAAEREKIVRDLQAQVRSLGGKPEDDGTILGTAHRAFLALREAVGGGDRAIVNEMERGEDHIKAKFAHALESGKLSGEPLAAVQRANDSVRAGHDRMSALKHSLDEEKEQASENYADQSRVGFGGGVSAPRDRDTLGSETGGLSGGTTGTGW